MIVPVAISPESVGTESSSLVNGVVLPEWPEYTIAVLSTVGSDVHAIPVTAPLRTDDRRILFSLKHGRGSLSRLRENPRVALTILATGNIAFTARGRARVVWEQMPGADEFTVVEIFVDAVDDHRSRGLTVYSGIALNWVDVRTQRFVRSHMDGLRALAADSKQA